MKITIAGGVVTADCAWVIDASSFGKTNGIVRVNDRSAEATIAERGEEGLSVVRLG